MEKAKAKGVGKALNKILSKRSISAVVALLVLFVTLSVVDIGLNSKHSIRRDFNDAFEYRLTGDCEMFGRYINMDNESWRNACESEKGTGGAIKEYEVQYVTHTGGSDTAFVQVLLTRLNEDDVSYTYGMDYNMKKVEGIWKINVENIYY